LFLSGGKTTPGCLELVETEVAIFSPFRFLISGQASGWCSEGCQAIVDTGTSLLTVPEGYLSTLMEAIGAQESLYGEVCVVC
jgi:hypothetical protein